MGRRPLARRRELHKRSLIGTGGYDGMKITTGTTEIAVLARENGAYGLALYRRSANRLIRFEIDPTLAWLVADILSSA